MPQLVITNTFEKELKKLGSVKISDILEIVKKHKNGVGRTITLFSYEGGEVLKSYLLGTKVRMISFLRTEKETYIPVWIVKKESARGENITKYDEPFLQQKIQKNTKDIIASKFTVYPVQ